MFGNADRHPFHPDGKFVAFMPFTLNGVDLSYGDPVNKDGVDPRLLRALYDQRKIDYAPRTGGIVTGAPALLGERSEEFTVPASRKLDAAAPEGEGVTVTMTVQGTPQGSLEGTLKGTLQATLEGSLEATLQASPQASLEGTLADASVNKKTGGHKVKHAGLGGWKVIDPKGVPVGPGHKTKAEAQAEADRLNAKG